MSQIITWKILKNCDLSEYTLVIPSVAVGNVAQLACDLVISSLFMRKIALLYSPALIPISGYNPYKIRSDKLAGCCELYLCEERKLLILHIRAPLVHKYGPQFLNEVIDKFKADKIKDIIVLTSSFASEKRHVMTSPFRYIVNEFCPHIDKLKTLDWVEHEPKGEVKIYGGGYSTLLYEIIQEKALPCLLLYKFSSEGDNIPDAYEMVQYLNTIVPLFDEPDFYSKLIHPVSWNLLFGGPPPRDIY